MEFKVIVSQPKLIDGRAVTGLAAVSGNIDSGYDRILHGAFRKTIKENGKRVRNLWMHDPWEPPTAAVKELLEVGADDLPDQVREEFPDATGGLQVTREYLDTPRGNEILAGIKAGAITEMSIGYDAVKFDFGEESEGELKFMVRNLREVRLWDVSDVTWGMNAATVAAKLLPHLEAYRADIPGAQYDLINQLVTTVEQACNPQALKAGRVLSARNLERLKAALDTLSEILLAAEPPEDDEKLRTLTETVFKRFAIAEHEYQLHL